MTTPNVPLLKRTLAHIKANPSGWNQDNWRCGTGMCFAGRAAILAGGTWYSPDPDERGIYEGLPVAVLMLADGDDDPEDVAVLPNGTRVVHVRDRAQRILGLTYDDAEELFAASNMLWNLETIVATLPEGEL